jgi:hypothetical protein
LDKLLKDFSQPEHPQSNRSILPSASTNTYDLTKILGRKKSKTTVTIPELQSEIKTLKSELQILKQAQHKDSVILQHLLSKINIYIYIYLMYLCYFQHFQYLLKRIQNSNLFSTCSTINASISKSLFISLIESA